MKAHCVFLLLLFFSFVLFFLLMSMLMIDCRMIEYGPV